MTDLPEGRWPTPEEWVAWFLGLDDDNQERVAAQVIDRTGEASRCFQENHVNRLRLLEDDARRRDAEIYDLKEQRRRDNHD